MEELDHIETQKKFDTLCGFKNYYVPYRVKNNGSIEPVHAFKDLEPSKAFTKQELLRGLCFGLRPNFNGVFIMDCDFKKDKNASKLPEKFRNTYIDDTKGGEHLIYIVENGIPPYWKYSTGKNHGTPYGADLFCEKNIGCVMTNSYRKDKYYNNIKYMAPQIIPKELFNEIDDFMKKTHLKKTLKNNEIVKTNKIVKKSFKSKSTSFKQLRKMLNLLPIKYFDNTNEWLKMCWIIHYETNGSQEGLELFEEMSRKVEEYKNADPNVYASQWKNANKANSKQLTIATLIKYLKDEGFEDKNFMLKENYIGNLINEVASSATQLDMANLAIALREGDIGYFKEDEKIMFWNGVYWKYEKKTDKASIKSIVFNDCLKEIRKYRKTITNKPMEKVETDKERKEQEERRDRYIQQISELIIKMQSNSYIEATASLIINKLQSEYVIEEINKADDYFCFKNRVWDLNNECWIDPNKTKHLYNTLYSPFDYREPTEKENKTLEKIYSQIQTDDITKREFFKIISTALSGKCLQKFIQMVGGGRNGKGLSNNLLLKLLGDNAYTGYGCTFDASIICGKKNNIGNEAANLGNKRFCKTSEPSKHEGSFNFSKIKKLTGGDKVNGRLCFGTKTEHNNNMTLCVEGNEQDQLGLDSNGKDEATKQRCIMCPHKSHFSSKGLKCKCKAKKIGRCFPINTHYASTEFKNNHVFALFHILTKHYIFYKNEGINLVGEMVESTKDYLDACDEEWEWFKEKFIFEEGSVIKLKTFMNLWEESDLFSDLSYRVKRKKKKKFWKDKFEENDIIIKKGSIINYREIVEEDEENEICNNI